MPDLAHLVLFLVLGALLGALGGLFGIGGGLIAIPVLTLFFRLDEQHAQGTALVMVAPNVMVGLWSYAQRGDLDRRVALLLAGSAVVFTYLGALYATRVAGPGPALRLRQLRRAAGHLFRLPRAARADGRAAPARLAWGWSGGRRRAGRHPLGHLLGRRGGVRGAGC